MQNTHTYYVKELKVSEKTPFRALQRVRHEETRKKNIKTNENSRNQNTTSYRNRVWIWKR